MHYQLHTLQDEDAPGSARLVRACQEMDLQGHTLWGVFPALFGLPSNNVYLVTFGESPASPPKLPKGVTLLQSSPLAPTVRPTEHSPRQAPGIYVFRWFKVDPANMDEAIALSNEAWPMFEPDFDAQVQGLLRMTDDDTTLLLITRYRDLSVWEASREPAPEARQNFLARHKLTRYALPICTRLAGADIPPVLVSET